MKNPIYRKELKQYARTTRTIVALVVFQLALTVIGLFAFYVSFVLPSRRGTGMEYANALSMYRILGTVELLLISLTVPAVSAGSVCGEREKQTLELLLSTTLSPAGILRGKLMASLHLTLLLMTASLPVFGLVFAIGGVSLRHLLTLYLYLVLTAVWMSSVSTFFSVLCKKTSNACLGSYAVLLCLMGGSLLFVLGLYVLRAPEEAYASLQGVYRGWVSSPVLEENWNLLLLDNPLFGFAALLQRQTGESMALFNYGSPAGAAAFLRAHWLFVSVLLKLAEIAVVQMVSVRLLARKG